MEFLRTGGVERPMIPAGFQVLHIFFLSRNTAGVEGTKASRVIRSTFSYENCLSN